MLMSDLSDGANTAETFAEPGSDAYRFARFIAEIIVPLSGITTDLTTVATFALDSCIPPTELTALLDGDEELSREVMALREYVRSLAPRMRTLRAVVVRIAERKRRVSPPCPAGGRAVGVKPTRHGAPRSPSRLSSYGGFHSSPPFTPQVTARTVFNATYVETPDAAPHGRGLGDAR
jgi:hypothetical protein